MYIPQLNLLFIAIPKTSGNLITSEITKKRFRIKYGHYPLKIWQEKFKINNKTTIFTIVRNPYEKMISLYFYTLKKHRKIVPWFSQNDDIDYDFNKWLEWNYNDNLEKLKKSKITNEKCGNVEMISNFELNFSNQLDLLKDKNGILDESIIIFEFQDLKEKKYLPLIQLLNEKKISNLNFNQIVNSSEHNHYSSYYNQKSKILIEKYFEDDIKYFGFKFKQN